MSEGLQTRASPGKGSDSTFRWTREPSVGDAGQCVKDFGGHRTRCRIAGFRHPVHSQPAPSKSATIRGLEAAIQIGTGLWIWR